jgi:multiple antibiotic resistance protein
MSSSQLKQEIIKRALKYSVGILVFFSMTGLLLFHLFGFSIGAFRIAGGVLLFTTAVTMLNPQTSHEEAGDAADNIALIPLSIPFIAGPGTIVTVVVLMSEAQSILKSQDVIKGILCIMGVYVGIALCIGISYLMMARSEAIDKRLKEGGRKVVTKVMGLIVMAIAIQFIINGIKDVLPEFIAIAGS